MFGCADSHTVIAESHIALAARRFVMEAKCLTEFGLCVTRARWWPVPRRKPRVGAGGGGTLRTESNFLPPSLETEYRHVRAGARGVEEVGIPKAVSVTP